MAYIQGTEDGAGLYRYRSLEEVKTHKTIALETVDILVDYILISNCIANKIMSQSVSQSVSQSDHRAENQQPVRGLKPRTRHISSLTHYQLPTVSS